MDRIDTDCLVIGSGIAGLVLAKLVGSRLRVTIVTKKEDSASNTNFAQGGIAAVFGSDDSARSHVADTLAAGDGLCDPEAVEIMVREGPALVRQLVEWGARFSTDPAGTAFVVGREGGHAHRRIVHSKDQTGREIEAALLSSVRSEPNVSMATHRLAYSLVIEGGRCRGALVLDEATSRIRLYASTVTVLATGGSGRIYRHTTNPAIATGDGVAMAFEAGARISNLEFIQFHPTMFYAPGEPNSFLVSEAVRGEGAILRTASGRAFMDEYHPLANLAPRDVVARAIASETLRSGDPCVFLDMTSLGGDFLRRRFPFIVEACLENGIDPSIRPVPVVPAAHYVCGGVEVDRVGQTAVGGLYAAGEVASTGVHGANRLASNSLLEALVWSHRAARDILDAAIAPRRVDPGALPRVPGASAPAPGPREEELLARIRDAMWENVGIVRCDDRLALAARDLAGIRAEADQMLRTTRVTALSVECRNAARVAELVALSALARKESRGLHYNTDHPEKDARLERSDTVVQKRGDAVVSLEERKPAATSRPPSATPR